MDALSAAKQAIADHDILYTGQELRSILANLIDYYETPVVAFNNRITLAPQESLSFSVVGNPHNFAPGFEPPNDTLDYSNVQMMWTAPNDAPLSTKPERINYLVRMSRELALDAVFQYGESKESAEAVRNHGLIVMLAIPYQMQIIRPKQGRSNRYEAEAK